MPTSLERRGYDLMNLSHASLKKHNIKGLLKTYCGRRPIATLYFMLEEAGVVVFSNSEMSLNEGFLV
ncbi:MAG: hypothetical protein IPP36_12145 [Nitrosomonadales bacterium]|nr:hypothetical protein [Nitrosomonadales bacterium]